MARVRLLKRHQEFLLITEEGAKGMQKKLGDPFVCDLLSHVLAHSLTGCCWVTVLSHLNCAALAVLRQMSCVVLAQGVAPDPDLVKRMNMEGIPLFTTNLPAFEAAKLLEELAET